MSCSGDGDGDGDDRGTARHHIRPASSSSLHSALLSLSDDVGGLWALPPPSPFSSSSTVPILERPPSSTVFLREYVSRSRPCLIRNAVPDGTGPLRLTLDDLVEILERRGGDRPGSGGGGGGDGGDDDDHGDENEDKGAGDEVTLTVDVTPDGRGDCIRTTVAPTGELRRMFVKPEERRMSIVEFRDALRAGRKEWNLAKHSDGCESPAVTEEDGFDEDGLSMFPVACPSEESGLADHAEDDLCPHSELELDRKRHPVLYYSRQNDCLRTELSPLFDSHPNFIPRTFPWAEQAFNTGPPDAVNLWVGDERAVSGMHKDHYENLFYVASGEKVFTLCPPGDAPFLHEGEFESGTFDRSTSAGEMREGGEWSIAPDYEPQEWESEEGTNNNSNNPEKMRWIEPDIERILERNESESMESYLRRYPLLRHAHPSRVYVREGDLLYLPSLWYHRVTQTCETVGINYWYDMRFDSPGWCYFNFLQNLSVKVNGSGAGE